MAGIRKIHAPPPPVTTPLPTTTPLPPPTTTTTTQGPTTPAARLDGTPAVGKPLAPRVVDEKITHELGQTADKTTQGAVSGQRAGENLLDKQRAIHASHAGSAVAKNELSPGYKLGRDVLREVGASIYAEKAPPELQAMTSAVGPHLHDLATRTATSVLSSPESMANLSSMIASVGKEGFTSAVQASSKDVFAAFSRSVGVPAKNPAAISAALDGLQKAAPHLGPTIGPRVAQTATRLGPQLLGEGAAVAGKAAATTSAKAAGQALPVVGNVISCATTVVAAGNFVGQLTKKPLSFEKILKEGVNTVAQGVGIAFPWVGLGGTLVDAAWGAKNSVTDAKKAAQGLPVTESANVLSSLPLLSDGAAFAEAACRGAGKHDVADKLATVRSTAGAIQQLDLQRPDSKLKMLHTHEQEALVALAHDHKLDLEQLAAGEDGPRKEALLRLASSSGALADNVLASMRLDKRAAQPGLDDKARKDLQTKRSELAGQLMGVVGDLGVVDAIANHLVDKAASRA